jgi:predicted ArsR family transcriptional regulator
VKRRRAHLSTARAAILDVLVDQPAPCTVRSLSALLHQHPNTIREHLDGLCDDRLVVRTQAAALGRGRPAWLYSAAPDLGSDQGASDYAGLASALAAHIALKSQHPRADAIETGRVWGRDLVRRSPGVVARGLVPDAARGMVPDAARGMVPDAARGMVPDAARARSAVGARRRVVALLGELGFDPRPDARSAVVKLRRCPLLEAAHQYPEVVCGVHLGVVRGALDELGNDPDRTERTALQSFSEPGACRLDLLPRSSTGR